MNTIKSPIAKNIFFVMIALVIIIVPSYISFNIEDENFRRFDSIGIIILLLFVGYPILSFALGIVSKIFNINLWIALLVTTSVYLGLFIVFYNVTAFIYIPVFLLCFIAGTAIGRYRKNGFKTHKT